jgi:Delta7-sterol 5-desaturase
VKVCYDRGLTQLYTRVDEWGIAYLYLSLPLIVVVHDAYFYWTHRALHSRWLYRRFHAHHHLSSNPSPWTAFSFHPFEAIVQAGIFLVVAFAIPAHFNVVFLFLLYMTIMDVLIHCGYELFPRSFVARRWTRWYTTSVNHNLHHRRNRGNFGLYFTWWDRLLGTLDAGYEAEYSEVHRRRWLGGEPRVSGGVVPPP